MTAAVVILLAITGLYVVACVLEACAPHVGKAWLPEAERPGPVRRGGRR